MSMELSKMSLSSRSPVDLLSIYLSPDPNISFALSADYYTPVKDGYVCIHVAFSQNRLSEQYSARSSAAIWATCSMTHDGGGF
jgi:hypothetical protein